MISLCLCICGCVLVMSWHHRQMESLCGSQFYMWRFYGASEPQRLEVSDLTPSHSLLSTRHHIQPCFYGCAPFIQLLVNLQGPTPMSPPPLVAFSEFSQSRQEELLPLQLSVSVLVILCILISCIVSESIRAGECPASLCFTSRLAQCFVYITWALHIARRILWGREGLPEEAEAVRLTHIPTSCLLLS